jgi:putative transposase
MIKTYKFKLFKNKRKDNLLGQQLFVFCQIYNHCIRIIKKHYQLFGKNPTKNDLQKHLTRLMERGLKPKWKALGYSQGIQEVTDRIYKSYQAFFNWCKTRKGGRKSPPSFKPFRKYKSFTLKQAGWKIDEVNGKIRIGGNWFRYNQSRKIEGTPKTLTVKRDLLGDWYIFIACEAEQFIPKKVIPMTGKSAGFDFGLKCFLTTSDNDEYQSPEFLKKSLCTLKQHSRCLSKKEKGSKNRKKAKKSLARTHRKIANQRLDFHFKLAIELFQKYDYLLFEDLNLVGMKALWGRKISDYGLAQFMKVIDFKSIEHEKVVHKVDRFFPSTKLCSCCGQIKEKISLAERVFECDCGNRINRDLNAAINIQREGASSLGLDCVRRDFSRATVA